MTISDDPAPAPGEPAPMARPPGECPLAVVADWPATAEVGVMVGDAAPETVGDRALRRPWASVTKVLVAWAILVATEEGTVDLDQPAGPPGSTLRHLLAHASGLGPEGEVVAGPGQRRIYSNRGIEVAAGCLTEGSGMSVARYVAEAVTGPLGMSATTLDGSAAWGASGPLADLLRLGAEIRHPRLIDTATRDLAVTTAWPGLDGVLPGFGVQRPNDWGLGLEVRGAKHPHWTGAANSSRTVGHFGQSGSFLWFDPVADVVCAGLADRPFGRWAAAAWPDLAARVLRAADATPRPAGP